MIDLLWHEKGEHLVFVVKIDGEQQVDMQNWTI